MFFESNLITSKGNKQTEMKTRKIRKTADKTFIGQKDQLRRKSFEKKV